MDPKMQRLIKAMEAKRKSSFHWQRGDRVPNSIYRYDQSLDGWKESQGVRQMDGATSNTSTALTIISWNIDFMRSFPTQRMTDALGYLRRYIEPLSSQPVIMLNEMTEPDLELIQTLDWIRNSYTMTDITNEFWESGYYGTCVLIPLALNVAQVFRVHYDETRMERDGLFVDLSVGQKRLRLCCTHLESLVANPPRRPSQLAQAAKYMHEADASILGGDLNAIQPFDKTLHTDNALKDAYLETGGVEDDESGMTWGQMAATKERNQFGLTRMDKFLFCGAMTISKFETFGLDAVVGDKTVADQMVTEDGLDQPWVTDHLGIRVDINMADDSFSSNL